MESLQQLETVILLLIAVLALAAIARKLVIPYPILLVIGGLVLGLIPVVPPLRLDPDVVFLVFLPPILWSAAYFTSWRDFRSNLRPITLLAVGLVLATTAAVATVARIWLPGLGWAGAIALGAIVSPPDAVSATAVAKRLGLPRRAVTILEGESLVNDATALILYRAAVMAAISGTYMFSDTVQDFFMAATAGVVIGLLVGLVARWALTLLEDSFSAIATRLTLQAYWPAWPEVSIFANISARQLRRRRGFKRGQCGTSLCSYSTLSSLFCSVCNWGHSGRPSHLECLYRSCSAEHS